LSTGITKGYRVNDSIIDVENRDSGLGQTAQTCLGVSIICTPPIHNLHSINVNGSREIHLQIGSGIISMRKGSFVVVNGITGRKLILESGGLSGISG